MITMNMTTKREVRITDKHFSLENNILTLDINIGDYDITGKQITAVFEPEGVETAPLTAETVEGVTTVSLPIYSSYISEGVNYIQLYFRWDTTKLEQSGKMMWVVERSLIADDPGVEQQDLMSYYLQQMVLAIAEADRVVDEAGDVRIELDESTASATAINNTLADPATGTIKLATDAKSGLDQSIIDAGIAKDALTNPTTGAIKLAGDAEDSLQATIDASKIGVLANLTTTEKSNLVGAINEVDADLTAHKEDYANLVTEVNKKANKVQEEWITPTLLNGATPYANSLPQYLKDNFGVVRLKGRIQCTTGVPLIQLPTGYRPAEELSIVCTTLSNTTFLRVTIDSITGVIKVYGTITSYVELSSIQFKAV